MSAKIKVILEQLEKEEDPTAKKSTTPPPKKKEGAGKNSEASLHAADAAMIKAFKAGAAAKAETISKISTNIETARDNKTNRRDEADKKFNERMQGKYDHAWETSKPACTSGAGLYKWARGCKGGASWTYAVALENYKSEFPAAASGKELAAIRKKYHIAKTKNKENATKTALEETNDVCVEAESQSLYSWLKENPTRAKVIMKRHGCKGGSPLVATGLSGMYKDARKWEESDVEAAALKCKASIIRCKKGVGRGGRGGGRRRGKGDREYRIGAKGPYGEIRTLQFALKSYIERRTKDSKVNYNNWDDFIDQTKPDDGKPGSRTYKAYKDFLIDVRTVLQAQLKTAEAAATKAVDAAKTTTEKALAAKQKQILDKGVPAKGLPRRESRLNKLGPLLRERFNIPNDSVSLLLEETVAEAKQKVKQLKAAIEKIKADYEHARTTNSIRSSEIQSARKWIQNLAPDGAGVVTPENALRTAAAMVGALGAAERRVAGARTGGRVRPVSDAQVRQDAKTAERSGRAARTAVEGSRRLARLAPCDPDAQGQAGPIINYNKLGKVRWKNYGDPPEEAAPQSLLAFLDRMAEYLDDSVHGAVIGKYIGQTQQGDISEFADKDIWRTSLICLKVVLSSIIAGLGELVRDNGTMAKLSARGTGRLAAADDPRRVEIKRWKEVVKSLQAAAKEFDRRADAAAGREPAGAAVLKALEAGKPDDLDKAIAAWDKAEGRTGAVAAPENTWVWNIDNLNKTVKVTQNELYQLVRAGIAKDNDSVVHRTGTKGKPIRVKQLKQAVKPFTGLSGVSGALLDWQLIDPEYINTCQEEANAAEGFAKCILDLVQKYEKRAVEKPAGQKCARYLAFYNKQGRELRGCQNLIRNHHDNPGGWKTKIKWACLTEPYGGRPKDWSKGAFADKCLWRCMGMTDRITDKNYAAMKKKSCGQKAPAADRAKCDQCKDNCIARAAPDIAASRLLKPFDDIVAKCRTTGETLKPEKECASIAKFAKGAIDAAGKKNGKPCQQLVDYMKEAGAALVTQHKCRKSVAIQDAVNKCTDWLATGPVGLKTVQDRKPSKSGVGGGKKAPADKKPVKKEEVNLNEQRLNKLAAKVRKKLLNE